MGLSSAANAAAGQEESQEQTKTLKEVLEEREEQMRDIEQLQGKLYLSHHVII